MAAGSFVTIQKAYHILGFSREASKEEVRAAYRHKALELHPDRQGSSEDKAFYAKQFQELKEAYDLLKRENYPALDQKPEPAAKPSQRFAGRSFSGENPEEVPLSEKLGLRLSWDIESWIIWGIVIPLAAIILVYIARFFAGKINL